MKSTEGLNVTLVMFINTILKNYFKKIKKNTDIINNFFNKMKIFFTFILNNFKKMSC